MNESPLRSELVLGAQDEATCLSGHGKAAVVIQGVVINLVENILDVELDGVLGLVVGHHGVPAYVGINPVRVERRRTGRRATVTPALVLHAATDLEAIGQLIGRPQV